MRHRGLHRAEHSYGLNPAVFNLHAAKSGEARTMSVVSSPLRSPTISPHLLGGAQPKEILFGSYLHKTPPLDRIFVSWKKRYFELSRGDPNDPSSVELAYYMDDTRKEKRGSINLAKFVGIRPNAKVGQKENVFALETQDRKYILRAPDHETKNIWLAKLCELCGQEQVYHVTVPLQPSVAYNEAILKFSSPTHVTAVVPSSGDKVMEIPYGVIRRVSLQNMYGADVIWFETCKKSTPDQFYFFTVPSGIQRARHIMQELKTATECCTGTLMIREDIVNADLSYISRKHYGCQEFPVNTRGRALDFGLGKLLPSWRSFTALPPEVPSRSHFRPSAPSSTSTSSSGTSRPRQRRKSEPTVKLSEIASSHNFVSLDEWSSFNGRQKRPSLTHQIPLTRRTTVDKFHQLSSLSSHDSDEGSDSSEVFEQTSQSPARRLSHQSSIASQDSSASSTSIPGSVVYSSTIPENEVLEDPFEQLEEVPTSLATTPAPLYRHASAPLVPPRSFVSLKQPQKRKLSAVH